MIDGSIIRVHQHASGGRGERSIGKSRGGNSSKIHAKVDSLGRPLNIILSEGQESEIHYAEALLNDEFCDYLLADKGYDSDALRAVLKAKGIKSVIPGRKNRNIRVEYDRHIYRERNQVERFFNRLKQFRRIATRYEKLAQMFMGAITLVSILIWLKL